MLLLDLGNSALKGQWWLHGQLEIAFTFRLTAGWEGRLQHVLKHMEIKTCYYASVPGSQAQQILISLLQSRVSADRLVAFKTGASSGILKNAYTDPEKLGVDRWLALLGAVDLKRDVIIVDAGSAITIDLLRSDGTHLGGAILPGFNTSLERFKYMLNKVDYNHPDIAKNFEPGCSTEACIHIDYHPTDITVVNRLINRWRPLLESKALLIVSGGDANLIADGAPMHCQVKPDLVFKGMLQQLKSECIE